VRTALDTNILSGLFSPSPRTDEINALLRHCRQEGALLISPVVYAELLAHPKASEAFLDYFFSKSGIQVEYSLDKSVWTEAGNRYARYAARRRITISQSPRRILADFLIGAHALVHADRLMTFDTTVYQQDFPELRIYPGSAY
jgi:hypothetical protein